MNINIDSLINPKTSEVDIIATCYAIAILSIVFNLSCSIAFSIWFNESIKNETSKKETNTLRNNTISHWILCIFIIGIMISNIILLAKKDLGMHIMILNIFCCICCFGSFITIANTIIKTTKNKNKKPSLIDSIIVLTLTISILSTFYTSLLICNTYSTQNEKRDIINWICFTLIIIYLFFIVWYSQYEINNKNLILMNIHIIWCIVIIPVILSFHLGDLKFNTLTFTDTKTIDFTTSSLSNIDSLYINRQIINNYTSIPTTSYEINEIGNQIYISSKKYDIDNQLVCTINNNVITIDNSDNIAFIYDSQNNLKSLAIILHSNEIITNEKFDIDTSKYTYIINMQKAPCIFNNMTISAKMNEFQLGNEFKFKVTNNTLIDTESNKVIGEIKDNMILVDSKSINTLTLGTKVISINGIFVNEEISNFTNNKIHFYYTKNDSKLFLNNSGAYE